MNIVSVHQKQGSLVSCSVNNYVLIWLLRDWCIHGLWRFVYDRLTVAHFGVIEIIFFHH